MDELERRLRGLADTIEDRPPVETLRSRVRARRRRRVTAAVAVSTAVAATAAVAVIGGALGGDPQIEVAPVAPDGGPGEEPDENGDGGAVPGLIPPTSSEGDHVVTPLVFPDGARGELVYPEELELAELGVRPDLWLRIETDLTTGQRTHREVETFRGQVEDVLTQLNNGHEPSAVGEYGRAVRYELDEAETRLGDVLAYQFGGWTMLVPVRGTRPPSEEMTEDALDAFGELLNASEHSSGYLLLEPEAPLRELGSSLLVFGHEDNSVTVMANACTSEADDDAGAWENRDGTFAFSWCETDEQVTVQVTGDAEFVEAVRDGVRIRNVEGVVDETWMTPEEMEAWQADTGRSGTWIVGYYFPADFDYGTFDPDVLVDRWKLLSDNDLDMSSEQLARASYRALGGRPPPGLGHTLRGIDLELRSAQLEGAHVTMDFGRGILFASSGTTGASAMAAQVTAIAAHYFPDADTLCLLVEGEQRALFHDFELCPVELQR